MHRILRILVLGLSNKVALSLLLSTNHATLRKTWHAAIPHDCVRQNEYYFRRFSVPQVSRCPAGIDYGCQVISGFLPGPILD